MYEMARRLDRGKSVAVLCQCRVKDSESTKHHVGRSV